MTVISKTGQTYFEIYDRKAAYNLGSKSSKNFIQGQIMTQY